MATLSTTLQDRIFTLTITHNIMIDCGYKKYIIDIIIIAEILKLLEMSIHPCNDPNNLSQLEILLLSKFLVGSKKQSFAYTGNAASLACSLCTEDISAYSSSVPTSSAEGFEKDRI